MGECSIDGCDRPVFVKSRGWCARHYHRWHRTGDPNQATYDRVSGTPLERWWAKVDQNGPFGCWLWTGGLDRNGYGQFDVITDGHHINHRAHRWGYQQLVRTLADDETLDHLCRVRACVRPEHLEPVPQAVNNLRGISPTAIHARKTHCPRGHEYDSTDSRGARTCRTCNNVRQRERYVSRGTPNGAKTHCKHGHEFTPENTSYPKRGGRVCRECARQRMHRWATRVRPTDGGDASP